MHWRTRGGNTLPGAPEGLVKAAKVLGGRKGTAGQRKVEAEVRS